jgi:Holliday junction resolvasome RuvABC endonuclease subunit
MVVQERPIVHRERPSGAAVAFGLAAMAQAFCDHKHIRWLDVMPATVKKHATGKGNAKKFEMVRAAREKWPGQHINDDNQADALHVLDWAMNRKVVDDEMAS